MMIRVLTFILVLAAAAKPARADKFDIVGAGCVPDSQTFHERKYIISGGAIGFAPGQVGGLQFHCPVPVMNTPTIFKVRFINKIAPSDDPNKTPPVVFAGYFKGPKARHGNFVDLATFQTNLNTVYATRTTPVVEPGGHGNFFIYWVKLELGRSDPNDDIRIFSVSLD